MRAFIRMGFSVRGYPVGKTLADETGDPLVSHCSELTGGRDCRFFSVRIFVCLVCCNAILISVGYIGKMLEREGVFHV